MQDRRDDPFFQKLSAIMLPIVLALCAYMAKASIDKIDGTLARIELKQNDYQKQLMEMRIDIAALQQRPPPPTIGFKAR